MSKEKKTGDELLGLGRDERLYPEAVEAPSVLPKTKEEELEAVKEQVGALTEANAAILRRNEELNAKVAHIEDKTGIASEKPPEPQPDWAAGAKMVRIKIPSGVGSGGRGDVCIGLNGKRWQIKRGEWVDVPEYVLEVLDQAVEVDYIYKDRENGEGREMISIERQVFPYITDRSR